MDSVCLAAAGWKIIFISGSGIGRLRCENLKNFWPSFPTGITWVCTPWVPRSVQISTPATVTGLRRPGGDSLQYWPTLLPTVPGCIYRGKGYPSIQSEDGGVQVPTILSCLDRRVEKRLWKRFTGISRPSETGLSTDSASVSIIGFVTAAGRGTHLLRGCDPGTPDLFNLGTTISAAQYPYLKTADVYPRRQQPESPRKPQPLATCCYEGRSARGGAQPVHLALLFLDDDTLQQGKKPAAFLTAIENIGDYPMDSLVDAVFIVKRSNQLTVFQEGGAVAAFNTTLRITFMVFERQLPRSELRCGSKPTRLNHPEHQAGAVPFQQPAGTAFYTVGQRQHQPVVWK
ncbi:hypothetical protein FQR65_LT20694 [Abscondita terminalis]|nr:hypothetical protein FQR65_LT20694 [Abscondita terminalis]